jgi:hypothetical protein
MGTKHDNKKDEFYCKQCNKNYKTYKTLWEHNKKFHNNILLKSSEQFGQHSDNVLKSSDNILKNYNCRYCTKIFTNIKTRWSHEQKCKDETEKIDNIKYENKEKELEIILKKEKNLILKQEKEILQLKFKLLKLTI